jgi:hypothetical protein
VFTVEFYQSYGCDATGYGEGQVYLGTRNTVMTDGSGDAIFALFLPQIGPE